MPPQSAADFAQRDAHLMAMLYPDAVCHSAYDKDFHSSALDPQLEKVIPWGWDAVVRQRLLTAGCRVGLLPDDVWLERLRQLQHRSTLLPLQPETRWAHSVEEVEQLLRTLPSAVLKAPWSGSGRGIRWVERSLSEHDKQWIHRVASQQRGVIVEPRRYIALEFALEYEVRLRSGKPTLYFRGLSLFESQRGVYRGNRLLDDDAIRQQVEQLTDTLPATRRRVERWLHRTVVPHYCGPLGIDLYVDRQGRLHVSEMNLRHTMGMVAHALLQRYPGWRGDLFSPMALHRVVLSLGSNMGNRALLLRQAIRALSERVGPLAVQSSVVETEPWGFETRRKFLNQVVVVDTIMTAEAVLHTIFDIEQQLGRRRDYDPLHPPATHEYQPRPIDIDIIFYDDAIVDSELLQIPHPRMHLRRFVLEPLCELMPEFVHPVLKKTMKELLEETE